MMRLTRWIAAPLLVCAPAIAAQGRGDTSSIAIAPAVLEMEGDYTAGARFDLLAASRRHEVTRAFPRSRYWGVEARGTLAADPDLNPDALSLGLDGGVAWSLAKPRVITFDPANVDAPGSAMEFDYGDLSLGARAHLEMNQRRTEARASFNAELIYTHDHQRGIWPFIPSLYAMGGVARSLASDARKAQSTPEAESYVRLVAGAAWHISADREWTPRIVRPVWFHAELDVYREDGGREVVTAPGSPISVGVFDGTRVTLGTAYRLLSAERGLLNEIFVRWTNGETPTSPAPRKAWMVGIVLSPRGSS